MTETVKPFVPEPSDKHARGPRFYIVAGLLTFIPLLVTYMVIRFVFGLLTKVGEPIVTPFFSFLKNNLTDIPAWLTPDWLQSLVAVILTLLVFYLLGRISTHVMGAQMIHVLDGVIARIPFAKTVYGSTKKLLAVLERNPGERFERVVFLEFPKEGMKVIGFVTSQMTDASTGEKLASVFVPTTPNPTSGYLEVVPVKDLVVTGWGIDEAMQYIISGGAAFPDKLPFYKAPPDAKL